MTTPRHRHGLALTLLTLTRAAAAEDSFCTAAGWRTVWRDDFDQDALDSSAWNVEEGSSVGSCRSAQCTRNNVYVEDGALVLVSDGPLTNLTTGAVNTRDKVTFSHTPEFRFCVSAQLPGGGGDGKGQGIWPAHWLMPNDDSCDPDEGEMDIMEMISGEGTAYSTYHWQTTFPASNCSFPDGHEEVFSTVDMGTDWDSTWHEYAVERSAEHVAFAIDQVVALNSSASDGTLLWGVPFYAILNTAVGGSWPGEPDNKTVFPTFHRIDKVILAVKDGA